ncbi:MAG TPA: ATP-dependent DNA ligase [Candidatus Limnocylindrales bacterium]|nr:ATP-dependent DNA ligase [Candidatus Limnocylindrales bacterium]
MPVDESDSTSAAGSDSSSPRFFVAGADPSAGRDPARWSHFAAAAEAASATTRRLEKARRIGSYFATLPDPDLVLAARFLAGHVFPQRDQRTTNVGGSALFRAIAEVTGMADDDLAERLVALGDLGDLAFEAVTRAHATGAPVTTALTLQEVFEALEKLAAASGTNERSRMVVDMLRGTTASEAKYLVKLLTGDLRIGVKEGAIEDAVARLYGVEIARVQWANMLTGDVGETALLARQGRLDDARMRLFHPLKFMLATPAADLSDVARQMPEEFFVEDKFDGIRAQVHVARTGEGGEGIEPLHGTLIDGVRTAIFSRTLDEITASFPDLLAALAALVPQDVQDEEASGLILDGEIVPVQGERILPFAELQKRLGRKKVPAHLLERIPAAFVVYDVLYGQGRVLIEEPLSVRRAVLETLPIDGHRTRRAGSTRFRDVAALDAEFDGARERGNEGLMVKDPRSAYKPGRRGRDWLKIKRALATLDVVVTAVEVGNGRRHKLLSDYTFAVRASESDPTLLNVGKAYSGLTDAEIEELSQWFREHTIQEFAHGKVRLVEPQIVIEVTFDLVQPSKRHKSGYALRFPRIVRVRRDKPASEIDTLATVARLASS